MRTIYYNGDVYTGELPLAEAFAVEEDKFIFAGSNQEARKFAGEDSILVDLKGQFVCSGFNDSHMHLLGFGDALQSAQLAEHTESLADLIECLRDFKSQREFEWAKEIRNQEDIEYQKNFREQTNPEDEYLYKKSAWLVGRGWNQDYFMDVNRMPNRFDLDQVSTEIPICAVRACGHCLVVNSKALEVLGVTSDSPQPEGGCIGMENGIPDGRFYDNAMDLVYAAIPKPDRAALKDMIRSACKQLNSYGITSCQTDDYCTFRNVPWQEINEAYKELEKSGELTVRVYEQSNFTNLKSLKQFVETGNKTGAGSEMFKIGPLKILGDGALGARTAYLSHPYADAPSTCGIPVFSQETLDEMIGYANEQEMQVAVHAIGDAFLDRVLSAYEKALKEYPRKDHRHGIVHCQITRPDQLKKIEELQLHIYAQSIFMDYDIHIVEERVGKELASTSYYWKGLMEQGVSVSNGTDCPVELPDALACMQCAVTRTTLREHVDPYLPDQAFTVQEALDSYTTRSAEASFEENCKGRIAPGMLADFAVLEENPFEVDMNAIKDISVRATYLGGKKVFERKVK